MYKLSAEMVENPMTSFPKHIKANIIKYIDHTHIISTCRSYRRARIII